MSEIQYPLYLVKVDGELQLHEKWRMGPVLDNGWARVELQKLVLDGPTSIRQLREDEECELWASADRYSRSK